MSSNGKFPSVLLGIYTVFFAVLAVNPVYRDIWIVENLTVWIIVTILLVLWVRNMRFSNLAYVLMAIPLFIHTIGGHYTFSNTPIDWVTNFFDFERNHYDRIGHFVAGFYVFAIAEWLHTKRLVANRFLLVTYSIFAIAMIAMSYEIIEWVSVMNADPEFAGMYLSSQGDVWDAQKDMLLNMMGSVVAVIIYFFVRKPQKGLPSSPSSL